MKDQLRKLYEKNERHWEVWVWLWMMSDGKNSITFTGASLCGRFGVSKSTLHRVLESQKIWNESKVYSEVEPIGKRQYRATFYPSGKKVKVKEDFSSVHDNLYTWLKDWYKGHDFEYVDLPKHKKYVKTICQKLEKAMKGKTDITEESLTTTFQTMFSNMPKWWVENGNIRLTTISKNFDKIIDQIRNNHGNKRKSTSIKGATTAEDFTNLAKA